MFESFVIMLREGVEAALVVCIALAFLKKSGRSALNRAVFAGMAAAAGVSLIAAYVIAKTGFDPDNEVMEGTLFLVSAVMVLSLLWWMWRSGKHTKRIMEQKLSSITASPSARLGVFAFTFVMVGREGVETVLFLSAVDLTSAKLMSAAGAVAGLGVAIALAIAFYRGSLRIDLRKFFAVTGAALLIFVLQLLVGGVHEFMEAGILPSSRKTMAVIGPLVKHNVIFVVAVLALPFALMLWSSLKRPSREPATTNPAEERKLRAGLRRERSARLAFSTLSILAIVALGLHLAYGEGDLALSPAKLVHPNYEKGLVEIPAADLEKDTLERYAIDVGGKHVRFLLYRTDHDVRTAFDACEVCGDMGYVQRGSHVICRNCLAEINAATIGRGGGCNPRPLPSTRNGDRIDIRIADLAKGADFFLEAATTKNLQCPVCGMTFAKQRAGGSIEYNGRRVYFCPMPQCGERLRKHPERYLH